MRYFFIYKIENSTPFYIFLKTIIIIKDDDIQGV